MVEKLKEFIKNDFWLFHIKIHNNNSNNEEIVENDFGESKDRLITEGNENEHEHEHGNKKVSEEKRHEMLDRDIEALDEAWRIGVVHLIGENEVVAEKRVGIGKRILIDYAYNFSKRNLRQTDKVFDIPHKRILKVGMTYEL